MSLPPFDAKRFIDILEDELGRFKFWDQFREWKIAVDALERRVAALEAQGPAPEPEPVPEPVPPPPPPPARYAPRAYNSTASADARFCCTAEYGCVRDGAGYRDAMGIRYDESMRDLGGRSNNTANPIPELKGANSMDGREPCEQYVGPTGVTIGGSAGYPAASFLR